MRAQEFTSTRVMAKIEKTGQIVQILKHQDGDFLINTNPDTKSHMGVKWIPDTTRFVWVRKFDTLKEVNYPDELSISDQIQQYFFKRGYDLAGEGRDQLAHARLRQYPALLRWCLLDFRRPSDHVLRRPSHSYV